MENQAKKRKGGAENVRDKNTSPALDTVLSIQKRLCLFILHKAQIFGAQIKAQKLGLRAARECFKYLTPELASHQTQNVHGLAG